MSSIETQEGNLYVCGNHFDCESTTFCVEFVQKMFVPICLKNSTNVALSSCNFIGLQFLKCVTWRSLLQSYTAQKMKYSVRISLVNVTKFAVSCRFGHIYWRNPEWKTSFRVQCYGHVRNISSIFDVWANFAFTNSETKLDC